MSIPHQGRLSAVNTDPDPRIQSILEYPGHSWWLKSALRLAFYRDSADVAREASILAEVLQSRADAVLGKVRR